MRHLVFTFLILSSISQAYDQVEIFQVAGKETKIYHYKKHQLSISKECQDLKSDKFCPDLKFLDKISLKKSNLEGTANINPGSVICTKQLSGTVFIGIDKDRNQNSFCRLSDGLLVDNGTLTFYARKNDGLVKPFKRKK